MANLTHVRRESNPYPKLGKLEIKLCAVNIGAEAVVVSNHGGRQLDSVFPTIRALPEVVAAVGHQTEVMMDGGIRRGSDIIKALCLGARAVLIGRAYAYGMAAAGRPRIERAISILARRC
jgi:isopentenyl diphosphate isomerase/L-lactate dehydrogenase-like FMN-dependent dehydrogenase